MRRTLPLALLICGVVLATGAAGYAVAQSGGEGSLGTIGRAADSTEGTVVPESAGLSGSTSPTVRAVPGGAAPVVTVPALSLTTAAATTARSTGPTSTPAPRTPAPGDAPQGKPAPAATASAATTSQSRATTPAHVALRPPYSSVLGWYGQQKVAYLTFDDGPGPATGRVLHLLARYRVSATFCEIGQRVAENPAMAKRVGAAGHTLCNHSWDHHSPFDALPVAAVDREIGRTQQAMTAATGKTARYFRAPGGAFGPPGGTVLQAGQRAGTIPLAWGVDSLDWTKPGARKVVSNVLGAVTPGAVILLHDGGGADREQTIAALPAIITGLRAAGYTLDALPADPPR